MEQATSRPKRRKVGESRGKSATPRRSATQSTSVGRTPRGKARSQTRVASDTHSRPTLGVGQGTGPEQINTATQVANEHGDTPVPISVGNQNLTTESMTQMLTAAIPVITQTVVSVLQNSGMLPGGILQQNNSSTQPNLLESSPATGSTTDEAAAQNVGDGNGANEGANKSPNLSIAQELLGNIAPVTSQTTESRALTVNYGLARPISLGVDPKLRADIVSNKYVDFSELLKHKKSEEKFNYIAEEKDGNLQFVRKKTGKQISNLTQWQDAFYIYAGIYCQRHPHQAPNLMKYGQIISQLAQMSNVEGALSYDETFRRWREQDPDHLPWEGVNGELHTEAMAMALSSFKNKGSFRPQQKSFPSNSVRTKHCFTFNNEGSCSDKVCKYGHFCQVCKGTHSRLHCPNKQTGNTSTTEGKKGKPQTKQSTFRASQPFPK